MTQSLYKSEYSVWIRSTDLQASTRGQQGEARLQHCPVSKDTATEWRATAKHIPSLQPSATGPPHNQIFSVVLCQKCSVRRLGISLPEHWGKTGKSDYSSTFGLSGSQELQNCHITAQKKAQEVAGNNAIPNKSHRETRIVTGRKIKKVFLNMCLAVYKGHLAAEQTRMSSACFNRELQNCLHTCPSNHMHRHRGKTGSTFYWARSQEGSFFCCRLFGNVFKPHVLKKKKKIYKANPCFVWCQTVSPPDFQPPRAPDSQGTKAQEAGTPPRTRNHSFPLFIPLNEPWSFGAPKASKQQVEIELIHGERKVQAQHRLTCRLNCSHTGSTTASSHLTCICVSSLFNLLFLETTWLTFLMKPGLVGSAPWHFFVQNRHGNLLDPFLPHRGKPAMPAQDDSNATCLHQQHFCVSKECKHWASERLCIRFTVYLLAFHWKTDTQR